MSAVPPNIPDGASRVAHFSGPFCGLSAEKLLAYYQRRRHVHYFSVVDEEQASPEKLAGILSNRFEFNSHVYQFGREVDWLNNPGSDIEWRILLHKFYYAAGLGRCFHQTGDTRYSDKWVELTKSWMARVPVDFLSSDVTGRRIQNWIFAYRYFVALTPKADIDAEFHLDFLDSIHRQVAYLRENLTPARNHRTLELYAIFLAAVVFPEFDSAQEWLDFSVAELLKNIQTDLLPDGVHCELSTDYHHIVLRNFLGIRRLAGLNGIKLPDAMDAGIKKALAFCMHAHKPDGYIPAISDGDSASFLELLRQGYALYQDPEMLYVATAGQQGRAPAQRCKTFTDSGYSIQRSGWGDGGDAYADERYLFFDCAPLGAGNHGHLDVLNIEMAAYGRSLIVDPGRYTYDESGDVNWRVLFRSTRYHNTVQVDGKNQTRYAAHVRKYKIQGPEPERELKCALSRPGFDYLHGIAASHEYPVVHERKILFMAGRYWLICDVLRAEQPHDYQLRFHLDALAERRTQAYAATGGLRVESPNLLLLQPFAPNTELVLESGFVSPLYGKKYPAPVVNFSRRAASCCFMTVLFPYRAEQPEVAVTRVPVHYPSQRFLEPVPESVAGALSISWRDSTGAFADRIFLSHGEGQCFQVADEITASPFLFRRQDRQGQTVAWHDNDSADSCQG